MLLNRKKVEEGFTQEKRLKYEVKSLIINNLQDSNFEMRYPNLEGLATKENDNYE